VVVLLGSRGNSRGSSGSSSGVDSDGGGSIGNGHVLGDGGGGSGLLRGSTSNGGLVGNGGSGDGRGLVLGGCLSLSGGSGGLRDGHDRDGLLLSGGRSSGGNGVSLVGSGLVLDSLGDGLGNGTSISKSVGESDTLGGRGGVGGGLNGVSGDTGSNGETSSVRNTSSSSSNGSVHGVISVSISLVDHTAVDVSIGGSDGGESCNSGNEELERNHFVDICWLIDIAINKIRINDRFVVVKSDKGLNLD
jgi:hypothetical protein